MLSFEAATSSRLGSTFFLLILFIEFKINLTELIRLLPINKSLINEFN